MLYGYLMLAVRTSMRGFHTFSDKLLLNVLNARIHNFKKYRQTEQRKHKITFRKNEKDNCFVNDYLRRSNASPRWA